MRIGFDTSQTAENKAGCGFFAEQLIDHLLQVDQANQYLLYSVFYNYRHPNYKNAFQSNQPNVENVFLHHSWREVNKVWDNPEGIEGFLKGPDIVHANNFSCPKNIQAKKIVTMYDVGFLDCPEYTTEENRLVCFNGAFEASIYADYIITISNFSKESFLKYFPHYPEDRVAVVYLGNRPGLQPLSDSNKNNQILKRLKIDGEYWLAVGTLEPRKNHRLLLKAYAQLVKNRNEKRMLVIAGGSGWMEESIQTEVYNLGIGHQTKFMGYVSDEELAALYSSCFAFVYPSFYEGFGLPVLEAMSCGAPVITSQVSSLPEVAGESAIYIDPSSCESLVEAMKKVEDNNLRTNLKLTGVQQASKFSWKKVAEEVLKIYEKVAGKDI